MVSDQRQQRIQELVAELRAGEQALAAAAEEGERMSSQPDASALAQRLRQRAQDNVAALTSYLGASAATPLDAGAGSYGAGRRGDAPPVSELLRRLFTRTNELAIGYTALHTMAMRLFELPLRELAPRHLRGHAEAAQAITQLLPQVVADELRQDGLSCMCQCPMCMIGVCGCVSGATGHVRDAWRETAPAPDETPGYPLQVPRPGSQVAAHEVPGGARVLAVDGAPVAAAHPYEVQGAIRKRAHGEPIQLTIRTGEDEPRDITVTRVDQEGR